MGRWDHFDKNRKFGERNEGHKIPEGVENALNRLMDSLSQLPESEAKELKDEMTRILKVAHDLASKPDTKPVNIEDVVAMSVLMYEKYDEYDNPALMIAVITRIAEMRNMNPNTFRIIASMITGMIQRRFK